MTIWLIVTANACKVVPVRGSWSRFYWLCNSWHNQTMGVHYQTGFDSSWKVKSKHTHILWTCTCGKNSIKSFPVMSMNTFCVKKKPLVCWLLPQTEKTNGFNAILCMSSFGFVVVVYLVSRRIQHENMQEKQNHVTERELILLNSSEGL